MIRADKVKKARHRSRNTPVEVVKAIRELVITEGYKSKPAIFAALEKQNLAGLPSKWTVYREVDDLLREWDGPDGTDQWSPATHGGGSPTVLAALADVIERTGGRVYSFTVGEVMQMGRLKDLVPDLLPLDLWRIAHLYAVRNAKGAEVNDLDAFLAFAPWRSAEDRDRYYRAIDAEYVKGVSLLTFMLLPGDAMSTTAKVGTLPGLGIIEFHTTTQPIHRIDESVDLAPDQ